MQRLAAASVVAVLAAGMAVPALAATETDYFTFLTPTKQYPKAGGDSVYERDGHREVEVTVTGVSALKGHRVTVFVNGHRVGTMAVSERGRAHREWDTEHDQAVPGAGAGSPVRVRTATGALIVSGRYAREADSD